MAEQQVKKGRVVAEWCLVRNLLCLACYGLVGYLFGCICDEIKFNL